MSDLLVLRGLRKCYRTGGTVLQPRFLNAVNGVDLTIRQGECFGIVGESGCGKSTLAKLIMGLETPTAGEICFKGQRIDNLTEAQRRPLRPRMQMVFQDSSSSLNPRRRVLELIAQPMLYHGVVSRAEAAAEVTRLLQLTGLNGDMAMRYPHELSGGQRQRVCLARALALRPELLVLDEPVSALDVSVQAQILNLLRDLQQELQLTCLFIGHGLAAVRYVSHRMGVMYMGKIVETGDADTLFSMPAHPYTRALIDAAPDTDPARRDRTRTALKGEIGLKSTAGCPLQGRCPMESASCSAYSGMLLPVLQGAEHLASCSRAAEPRPGAV